jgi:Flp pilus assembly protein TadG
MSLLSFLRDRRGGVAPMFGLAIIPVVGLIGFSVDYTRANAARSSMQAALDATALAMAKSAATSTADSLRDNARAYFNQVIKVRDATFDPITVTYTTQNGSQLDLKATGRVNLTFSGVLNLVNLDLSKQYTKYDISATSTIKWGNQRLRVALALDTTGSMASAGKIAALKTATKNLLDQLKTAAVNNGDVYVSIIPFSKDVNVGPGNTSATWLQFDDGTDASWDGTNGSCSKSGYSPRSSCTGTGTCSMSGYNSQSSCTSAGTCSLSSYTTQSTCTSNGSCSIATYTSQSNCTSNGICSNPDKTGQWSCTNQKACSKQGYSSKNSCETANGTWAYGAWTTGVWTTGQWTAGVWTPGVWTPNNRSTWNGCVTDRGAASGPGTSAGNDQTVTTPTTSDATTLFYPEQYPYCSPAIKGLSYDWTAMKAVVDGLYPAGSTNQPIGLVWGWQSLVGDGPFGTVPAKDSNYTYKEVIILLSDGLNTQDRWYGNGSDTSTSVDRRMYYSTGGVGTCKNIKDSGITIYAVQVNTGGDAESQVMKNCASTDKFVMLTTASQIVTTFQQIGTQLSQLRIAK